MSVRAMTWAWDQPGLHPTVKLVLMALADHAGDDGCCFPSSARLATKCGVGERQVRRALDLLEERGLLTRERRRRDDGTLGTYLFALQVDQRTSVSGSPADTHDRTSGHPRPEPADMGVRAESSYEPSYNRGASRSSVENPMICDRCGRPTGPPLAGPHCECPPGDVIALRATG